MVPLFLIPMNSQEKEQNNNLDYLKKNTNLIKKLEELNEGILITKVTNDKQSYIPVIITYIKEKDPVKNQPSYYTGFDGIDSGVFKAGNYSIEIYEAPLEYLLKKNDGEILRFTKIKERLLSKTKVSINAGDIKSIDIIVR